MGAPAPSGRATDCEARTDSGRDHAGGGREPADGLHFPGTVIAEGVPGLYSQLGKGRATRVNARQPLIHFRPFRSDPPPHEQSEALFGFGAQGSFG